MSTPELRPNGTWLPEPIPQEHFSHLFYGRVALHYWNHLNVVSLDEAVVPTAEELYPQVLIDIGGLVEADNIPKLEQEYGQSLPMWSSPKRVVMRDDGRAIGEVGDHTNVLAYLKKLDEEFGGYDNDVLTDELYTAAARFRGEEFRGQLQALMHREFDRRLHLRLGKSPTRARLSLVEPLPS